MRSALMIIASTLALGACTVGTDAGAQQGETRRQGEGRMASRDFQVGSFDSDFRSAATTMSS